jgi:hypothetical protein
VYTLYWRLQTTRLSWEYVRGSYGVLFAVLAPWRVYPGAVLRQKCTIITLTRSYTRLGRVIVGYPQRRCGDRTVRCLHAAAVGTDVIPCYRVLFTGLTHETLALVCLLCAAMAVAGLLARS